MSSPGTKTGTRARSPKPPFHENALLSPSDILLELGCCGACGPGNCPKRESLQKWSGEGAKGLFQSLGPRERRSPKSPFARPKPSFAPVQPHFAPMQEDSCSRCPEHLLHPLLTTFGNFSSLGNFPGPQLPNVRVAIPADARCE